MNICPGGPDPSTLQGPEPRDVRILAIDDDPDVLELLNEELQECGYALATYSRPEEALAALGSAHFDLVLTDVRMPGMDGVEVCRRVHDNWPHIPVIVVTAFADLEVAQKALRVGASDLLFKPFALKDLEHAVAQALRQQTKGPRVDRLHAQPGADPGTVCTELIGSSPAISELRREIQQAARSEAAVLIVGETGTGKEIVARAVHQMGRRNRGPFVVFDCAAVPDELFESELFGHVRGAFTDAVEDRTGLLLQAHRGTLLFDEVETLSEAAQAKLLRVLQDRTVRPVGSRTTAHSDARIIAATNTDLEHLVREHGFRRDLFFRLDVLRIEVPPLRERGNDVVELAWHFLETLSRRDPNAPTELTPETMETIRRYPWPGNVRELRNCIEAAVAVSHGEPIEPSMLPAAIRKHRAAFGTGRSVPTLDELERRHIERVLRAVGHNKAEAARRLGISRATLYRKLRELEH